jgi:hypothetical protein
MRLHRILSAALTILASAPLVTSSPAFAQMFQEGLAVHVRLPATVGSQPPVPMFGGRKTIAQTSKPLAGQQTAQMPGRGKVNPSSTFVAPGAERNAAAQIEQAR